MRRPTDLLMTPEDAFKIASLLHSRGLTVHTVMQHACTKPGYKTVGDDERRAGKTAAVIVSVDFDTSLDNRVWVRDRIAELGFESNLQGDHFSITGRSAVS